MYIFVYRILNAEYRERERKKKDMLRKVKTFPPR